jgi:hypothetical protein
VARSEKGYPHRFAEVVQALGRESCVRLGQPGASKTFGHSALKFNDKIFALVSSKGTFVVKLPKERVAALVAAGSGTPFQAGKGDPMKEWLAVDASTELDWVALALEALSFVRTVP